MPDPNIVPDPLGDDFYESVKPLAYDDPNNDYALKTLAYGLAQMFKQAELYGRTDEDGNPGWSILFDVNRAPADALPYLAQYVGERIPVGISEADARARIVAKQNQQRGTPASIIAATQSKLYGTKFVALIERLNGDAYKMRVITNAYETPYTDQTLTNLVPNPSAEVNTTGWTSNGTLARVTSDAKFGSACFQMTATIGGGLTLSGPSMAASGGGIQTASCWVKPSVTRNVILTVFTSAWVASAPAVSCPAGVWTKLERSFRSEVASTAVSMGVTAQPVGVGETVLVDGLMMLNRATGPFIDMNTLATIPYTPPGTPPDYFDGSIAGASWTGTAHASTSTLGPTTTLVRSAINEVKPAGIVLDLVHTTGTTYDQLVGQYNSLSGSYNAL